MSGADLLSVSITSEPGDDVLQLANIPWPTVGREFVECAFLHLQRFGQSTFRFLGDELPADEFRDVVPSFA
jgi:hypothetical protein